MRHLDRSFFYRMLPYVLVFFAPLPLFLFALINGQVLFWGTPSLQFIPWRVYGYALLEQGILPFWNPLNGMGAPLFANYQSAFLYPPSLILYIFYRLGDAPAVAWGSTLLIPLHLGWAGCGMMLLVRQLGVRLGGQIIAGLAFGMCAYLVTRGMFFSMIWAGAWLPWLVWAADRVVTAAQMRPLLRNMLLLAMVFAFQLLAGHAQLTWYSVILASAWVVVRLVGQERIRVVVSRLGLYTAGLIIAVMMALPQLLPTFEYLQQSQRSSAVNFDFAMTYSLWPWRLLGFLLPDLFGNPGSGNYWGYGAYWEDAVYIGIVPFLLAASTLVWIPQQRSRIENMGQARTIVFLWSLIFLSVLLALGKNTPLFPWLYEHIPTFDMFQAPARYLFWTTFGLACLAGIAADRWKRPIGKSRKNYTRLMVASLAIMLGSAGAGLLLPQIESSFIRAFILLAVFLFCTAILALKTPLDMDSPAQSRRLWVAAVLGMVVVDLWLASANANPVIEASFYKVSTEGFHVPETRTFIANQDEYNLKFERYLSMMDFHAFADWQEMRAVPLPNLNLLDNIAMTNNFDPLLPGWFVQWMTLIGDLPAMEQSAILTTMGVESIIRVEKDETHWWVEHIQPGKRITWKSCENRVSSLQEALQAMIVQAGGQNAFSECIIVESNQPCADEAQPANTELKFIVDRADLMVIDIKTNASGWMRIADSWYPGWKAKLDGKEVPIQRADAVVKSVCIPAGEHQLTLSYLPTNIIPATWVSLLTIVASVAAAVILRRT